MVLGSFAGKEARGMLAPLPSAIDFAFDGTLLPQIRLGGRLLWANFGSLLSADPPGSGIFAINSDYLRYDEASYPRTFCARSRELISRSDFLTAFAPPRFSFIILHFAFVSTFSSSPRCNDSTFLTILTLRVPPSPSS